jgi:hypothetical protein
MCHYYRSFVLLIGIPIACVLVSTTLHTITLCFDGLSHYYTPLIISYPSGPIASSLHSWC